LKRFLVLFLLCLLPTSSHAAALNIVEVTSAKGVKAWLVEDEKLPLVAMKFAFRGGVEQDPIDRQGLSHLLADMLTEGAGEKDATGLQLSLANNSISIGFKASRDAFEGSLKSLKENQGLAFNLLRDILMRPRFDNDALAYAKRRQAAAIRSSLGDPAWQARFALFGAIYGDHPYSYRSLGSLESLQRIGADDLRAASTSRLAKDNLILAVAGAISPKELAIVLDRVFGNLPDHAKLTPIPTAQWPDRRPWMLIRRDGTQTNLLWATPGPARLDPDYDAAEIANYILGGGGFASRLMKTLRDENGMTYGVGTGLMTADHSNLVMGSMAADNARTAEAIKLIQQTWADFFENGPSDEEIEKAKDYLSGSLALRLSSTDAIAEFLLQLQEEGLGKDYLDRQSGLLRRVTKQDIRRALDKWFNPNAAVFSMAGQPDGVDSASVREPVKE
jgi:zinc protease